MAQPTIQPSFAAGELSPSLHARVDLAKYHVGAAKLKNFWVDYRGGVSNRQGLEFVGQAKQGTSTVRLIRFQFSTIQAYVLEFSSLAMRVIRDGGYVTDTPTTITGISNTDPGVVTTSGAHGYTTGDWVYISGVNGSIGALINGQTVHVTVLSPTTFSIQRTLDTANINTTAWGTYTADGTSARIYTLATPYIATDLLELKFAQDADVMTIVHPSYAPRDLTRSAHNSWTLSPIVTAAELSPPPAPTLTPSDTGTSMYGYQITAISDEGDESIASEVGSAEGAVDISTTTGGHIQISWTAVTGADSYIVYKTNQIKEASAGSMFGLPAPPLGTLYGFMTSTQGVAAVDTHIAPDFSKTPPLVRRPFSPGQVVDTTVTAGGTSYTTTPSVAVTGGGGGSGAVIRAVVVGGAVVSLIIIDPGSGYTSAPTLTISGGGGSGATATATVGAQTGTYPSVVSYFQQRRVYAATRNSPESFWTSQPGRYNNFNVSDPTRDDDAITATLASLQVNAIKHMIPMPGGLIALTSYGAWQITGGGQTEAISPADTVAQAQAYNGVADLPPLVINYDIIYLTARGQTVRDFAYNFNTNIYTGVDISTLSSHLFIGYRITGWDYNEAPYKIIWACRNDGRALSCTFLKEQDVVAWAQHATKGLFMDCCVVPESNLEYVYFVVRRTILGITTQYVERLNQRLIIGDRENCNFLDSSLTTAFTTFNATIYPQAASGSNVVFLSNTPIFTSGMVGQIIRAGGGIGTITAFDSSTQIRVNITQPIDVTMPEDPDNTPLPVQATAWSVMPLVGTARGLWHLVGQQVAVFGDGVYQGLRTVNAFGTVTVFPQASYIVVGLPYSAEFQTLPIDLGGQDTIQGKRKTITALTVRITDSIGFKIGPDFDNLEVWNPNNHNFQDQVVSNGGLYSGDYRRNITAGWNVPGQVCIKQEDPYPITILGVMPELVVGDGR